MTQPVRLSPDSLLAHEPFVRAVVRDLLRDEHRVQDVLQETWIRALAKGPRESGSLKGWLASVARRLALDQHRGNERREQRERAVARGEALESVDALHARLEAQREVVDALLAYYEQLAPQAIGERLGRSAATVRSQLSRAHEILKRRLDAHHGGDRSAWAGVLLPWALAQKTKVSTLVAAGVGVALLGTGVWLVPRLLRDDTGGISAPIELAAKVPDSPADVRASLDPVVQPPTRSSAAASEPQTPAQRASVPDLKLATLGNDALMDLAVQAMRALERKVLTPEAKYVEQEKELLALPDTGIVRVLARTPHGSTRYEGLVFPREGGCFYSFAALSHDYDRDPDLCYQDESLLASGRSMILQVGDVPLADVRASTASAPAGIEGDVRSRWEFLFTRIDAEDPDARATLSKKQQELRMIAAPGLVGQSYVLRGFTPGSHDHLVALRVLAKDPESITFSWRILMRLPRPGEAANRAPKPTFEATPAGPAWMEAVSVEDLVGFLHSVRAVSQPRLLEVPEHARASCAWLLKGADGSSGCFRLLPEHQYRPLVELPYAGAYYSIEERRYVDWSGCEIGMPFGELSTQCAGQAGWVLDLGELSRDELRGVLVAEAPKRVADAGLEKWNFLWETRSELRPGWRAPERFVKAEDDARARQLRLGYPIPPVPGHSFLLRSILSGGADKLLLMTTLETSKDGTSFSWRELKRFDR